MTDTERLNKLQEALNGSGVICRHHKNGRGLKLYGTIDSAAGKDIREVIDNFLEEQERVDSRANYKKNWRV